MNINERAAGSTDILLLCLDFGPRFCPCELCKGIVFSYIGPILDQHIRFQNFNRTIFLFLQHYLDPCVAQDQLVFKWSGACTYEFPSFSPNEKLTYVSNLWKKGFYTEW